ncbi:DUF2303 family protein [Bradyrhizobium guangzhouense]|nr:DUF2303 family protein [Bradyrhizobium guangzhouense]
MDQATSATITPFPFVHYHKRFTVKPIREIAAKPAFIDQLVNIDQTASLVAYVNRFKTADTVIFADVDELEVHAVIDYHPAGSAKRGLAEHRAVLTLAHSHEWDTWNAISGHMFDPKAFARIIDFNAEDIASPLVSVLREAIVRLGSDATALPPLVTLTIPVFAGEPKVDVKAITDTQAGGMGKTTVGLELVRARIIVEAEMARIANIVASATSVPVILGSVRD